MSLILDLRPPPLVIQTLNKQQVHLSLNPNKHKNIKLEVYAKMMRIYHYQVYTNALAKIGAWPKPIIL